MHFGSTAMENLSWKVVPALAGAYVALAALGWLISPSSRRAEAGDDVGHGPQHGRAGPPRRAAGSAANQAEDELRVILEQVCYGKMSKQLDF